MYPSHFNYMSAAESVRWDRKSNNIFTVRPLRGKINYATTATYNTRRPYKHCVSKNGTLFLLTITKSNVDRF